MTSAIIVPMLATPWPASNGFPVGHPRCATCAHRFRGLIEDLAHGGTSPAMIIRILDSRGESAPGADSIRNHMRRHRASGALVARVTAGIEVLNEVASANFRPREERRRKAARSPAPARADDPQVPGMSPADPLRLFS